MSPPPPPPPDWREALRYRPGARPSFQSLKSIYHERRRTCRTEAELAPYVSAIRRACDELGYRDRCDAEIGV